MSDNKNDDTTTKLQTDEEKVAKNGVQSETVKTDDEKINEAPELPSLESQTDDKKAQADTGSPEPEYTPPSSSNSWSTMDEVNKHTDKQTKTGEGNPLHKVYLSMINLNLNFTKRSQFVNWHFMVSH